LLLRESTGPGSAEDWLLSEESEEEEEEAGQESG